MVHSRIRILQQTYTLFYIKTMALGKYTAFPHFKTSKDIYLKNTWPCYCGDDKRSMVIVRINGRHRCTRKNILPPFFRSNNIQGIHLQTCVKRINITKCHCSFWFMPSEYHQNSFNRNNSFLQFSTTYIILTPKQ